MKNTLTSLIKKAKEFHGHLGPFLILGLRIGLLGFKKLNLNKNKIENLYIIAALNYSIPYSCIIDGLQVSTGCTIGNKKLIIKNSSNSFVKVNFLNKKDDKCITISVNKKVLNKIIDEMKHENKNSKKILELAKKIALMPNKELFIIH